MSSVLDPGEPQDPLCSLTIHCTPHSGSDGDLLLAFLFLNFSRLWGFNLEPLTSADH